MIPRLPPGYTHPVLLGRGSYGAVYRVRQTGLDRLAALKIVRAPSRADAGRLLQEARTQGSLRLSCIPQTYNAFRWRRSICLLMEWVHGVPLSALPPSAWSPGLRRWAAASFCEGLACIHGAGVAHRDLKPHNCMLTAERGVMLVDLGFAVRMGRAGGEPSQVRGTRTYMAPEVMHGRPDADPARADVYAAGVILRDVLGDEVRGAVDALLDACGDDDPLRRPADGRELHARLRQILGEQAGEPHRRQIASLVAANLCERLCDAASLLLDAGRGQEAYWLLVEAVEQDPDHGRALALMADFNRRGRRPAMARWVAVGAAASACAAIGFFGVFEAGRRSAEQVRGERTSRASPAGGRVSVLSALRRLQPAQGAAAPGPNVRQGPAAASELAGRLRVVGLEPGWHVAVDGAPVDSALIGGPGLTLGRGMHLVTAASADGRLQVRERVQVLPFEEKAIDLAPRQ